MQPIPIPKPAQSVFPISVQFPSRDRLLKVALFGCLFFLQLVSHLGFALPHRYIFVCWRSIACTFTGDCLFICLFFAQLQARLARLHSPRCLFCTHMMRLGRKRIKWMSRTTVPRKKMVLEEKNSTQNQGGSHPERHFLSLSFSQKSIITY